MSISAFRGLNNVTDPLRLGLGWLAVADNVDITDTGGIMARRGYTQVRAGSFTGAYSTQDFSRMYTVLGGTIRDFVGNLAVTLTSTATMFWAEVNDQVFFSNGTDSGIILPDNTVLPWAWTPPSAPSVAAVTGSLPAGAYLVRCTFLLADGRETGAGDAGEVTLAAGQALQISSIPLLAGGKTNVYIAPANSDVYQLARTVTTAAFVWNSSPDALGRDLLNIFLDPLQPGTDVVQAWKGKMYAAQYMASEDQTAVWFTEPLAFHLFNLNSNFFLVPGRVVMMAPTDDALIVGTDRRVYAYSGDKISQLAEYGAVPGQNFSKDDDKVIFWTTRGLCSALPFTNLTDRSVSVAPGMSAGGTLVRHGGRKRYLVALKQGGSAFNSYA